MDEIGAIVLAAGMSTRMGEQKLLLTYGETTVIEKVISNILASNITNILVVLGANHDELAEKLKTWPVKTIRNEKYQDGMHTSVICGVSELAPEVRAILVFLGDQPFIPAAVINQVVQAWSQTGKGIVIPVFNGRRGHPVLFDSRYRSQIENLDPEKGLRSVSVKNSGDVLEVETFYGEIVRDIDTREDYLNELNKINENGRTNQI